MGEPPMLRKDGIMFKELYTLGWSDGSTPIVSTAEIESDARIQETLDCNPVATEVGVTDVLLAIPGAVKGYLLKSDQDVSLSFATGASPIVIALEAGIPRIWFDGIGYDAELTDAVVGLTVTTTAVAAPKLEIRIQYDATE